MKKNLYLMAVAAIVTGCSSEDSAQMQEPAGKPAASELQQLVFGTAGTRAHWEDGDTKLTFAWDADNVGTELVCAIASEGAFAPGYKVAGNEVGEAEYASYLTIVPNVEDAGLATFTTVNSFHKDLSLVGQTIHAVTPVGNDKVTSTAGSFSVEMEMPNTFTQTASGDLSHLKPYMQMYATGIVAAGNTDLTFNHIPATLGFNIVNSGSSAVIVKSVTIDAVEASNGVLATALSSSVATYSAATGLAYAAEGTHSAVTTTLGGDDGVSIEADKSYLAYALVLPLAADEALQNAYLRVRVTTDEGTYTLYTLSGEQLKTKTEAENYNWQSGQFYGFKLTIPELEETACTLPKGKQDFGETSLTKIRFVAGSARTSESLYDETSGTQAYYVENGEWLEIHTSAKEFILNNGSEWLNSLSLTAIDFGCNFNTTNLSTMYKMFRNRSGLTALDLSGFNTANVADMRNTFDGCSSLHTLILGENFVTSKVAKIQYMFNSCAALASLDLRNFNTAKVIDTDMNGMFNGCLALTSLDLSNFSTANVTGMNSMFNGCAALTTLTLGENFNTANVNTMAGMFKGCALLESIDVSRFNTANVTTMAEMFSGCKKLKSVVLTNFNTANVTAMNQMFRDCSALTSLDLSSFNTEKVTNMKEMFRNHNLTTADLSSFSFAASPDVTYFLRNREPKLYVSRDGYTYLLEHVDSGNGVSSSNMYDKSTNRLWSEIIAEEGAIIE